MHEAKYYKKLEKNKVNCILCPKKCIIAEGSYGFCKARKNIGGVLNSVVYSKPCAVNIDPIEKKPFYHFLPGTKALSIGTIGCNLGCMHCQNWEMSRSTIEEVPSLELLPEQAADLALSKKCASISYTYNEPTVFFEYMLDCAKHAKAKGLKNTIVSNGFIMPEPLKELCRHIDAANIDLKSFSGDFYRKVCIGELRPVLDSLKILKKSKVWLEITCLLIEGLNNDPAEIKAMCSWIRENLGTEVPLHFTAFYPQYRMLDIPPTRVRTIEKAREIALDCGISYVYAGNVNDSEEGSTFCPKCRKLLIKRQGFNVAENMMRKNKCFCGHEIAGFFQA